MHLKEQFVYNKKNGVKVAGIHLQKTLIDQQGIVVTQVIAWDWT